MKRILTHTAVLLALTASARPFDIEIQRRHEDGTAVTTRQTWQGEETAIIVCDMWDKHWCKDATARVAELAPRMNEVLKAARARGVTVIHAPSDTLPAYEGHPARRRALGIEVPDSVRKKMKGGGWAAPLPSEQGKAQPLEVIDGGCTDEPRCKSGKAWSRQTAALDIDAGRDLISDDGLAIGAYLTAKGVTNVVVMGVHANMCVTGRPFGLRKMVMLGMNTVLMRDMTDTMYNSAGRPHVPHIEGNARYVAYVETYIAGTVTSCAFLNEPFAFSGAVAQTKPTPEQVARDRARNIRLPQSDGHYRQVKNYVEDEPDADYIHAPEEAYEAFRDIKFSVRIHWGVYSEWGIEASWPFLNMPAEKKTAYNNLYRTFNPTDFDADRWMAFFQRCGMQAFAFTAKHHDGFSMFHTRTTVKQRTNYQAPPEGLIEPCSLHYSIAETPFQRDIVGELCNAARRNNIKINLYFSHPDWYDADFRPYNYHPLSTPDITQNPHNYYTHDANKRKTLPTPDRTPEETARMIARHREQIHELLTRYGPVDMMCLDQWLGKDAWPDLKETVKMARQWSPDTLFRARGIGNYGDYFQPEQFVPGGKENTGMPWMSICLLGKIFAFDPVAEHYKGSRWVIHNLIDCVAKGGSFMVCIGPDAKGRFHPEAVRQLEEVGDWLKINGRGIYETRGREVWKDGSLYFTRSKDGKKSYALTETWPGAELVIPSMTPRKDSPVYLFGYEKPLKWTAAPEGNGVVVEIPAELQTEENRPCKYAWGFEFACN